MPTEVHSADPSPPLGGARSATDPLRVLGGLSLVLALLAIAWFFVLLVRDVGAANFTRLDARAVRLDVGPGWVDPRWEHWIALALAALPELDADAPDTRAALERTLAGLPFVAALGTTRVLWPDGVRIEVRFREPVACLRAGELFITLGADGTVLPGLWSLPPAREAGFLPLIACDAAGRAELAEGVRVTSPALVDGLAVVNALWDGLQAADWSRLGRIVIDARQARAASVEEPGTVLWLEGSRRVYFGRSPNLDAPGELPVATKCASLAAALVLLGEGAQQLDWELVDVRWDKPETLPRGGLDEEHAARGTHR